MFRNGVSFPWCLSQMSPPSCQPVLGALARAVPTSSLSRRACCGPTVDPVRDCVLRPLSCGQAGEDPYRAETAKSGFAGSRLQSPRGLPCWVQHFWISVYGGPCWGLDCTRSGAGCPARPCMRQEPFQVLGSGCGDKGVQNAEEACKLLVNLW